MSSVMMALLRLFGTKETWPNNLRALRVPTPQKFESNTDFIMHFS